MKKRDLEKLLQNSLPKQPPDLWNKIEQSYFIEGELPPMKKHVPWYRYAAAAACVGFAVLVGAQMFPGLGINTSAKYSYGSNSGDSSESNQTKSEYVTEPTTEQIINDVDNAWKEKYTDITITNEWQGMKMKPDNRTIVLFGSLKSDSRQGVAEVVKTEGGVVTNENRFLSSEKHGALKVTKLGSSGDDMYLVDDDGLEWHFGAYSGFIQDKIKNKPQIISRVDSKWKTKYPDINITNEWLSKQDDYQFVILFGSLKSTPRKGVAVFIQTNGDGSSMEGDSTFLSPEEHGALKVTEPGSEDAGMSVTDEDGIQWSFSRYGYFKPLNHTYTLPQINNPSNISETDTLPQVINNIDNGWKENNEDITITNGWLSAQDAEGRTIVLCGSLKSDPRQGVADVIRISGDGRVYEQRFLSPEKHGALTVSDSGSNGFNMGIVAEDGKSWTFHIFNGFNG